MLTDEQLQEIEVRCEAATPGPWEDDNGDVYTGWSREEYADERGYKPQGTGFDEIRICEINSWNIDVSDEEVSANAAFIAHARTDISSLLAHIRELEAEKAHLRRAFEVKDWNCERCPWREDCGYGNDAGNCLQRHLTATKEAPCPK